MKIFTDVDTQPGQTPEYAIGKMDFDRPYETRPDDFSIEGHIVRNGKVVPKPETWDEQSRLVREQREARQKRQAEYGSIAEQMDMIFHDIEAWRAHITAVKEKHPIPDKAGGQKPDGG